MEGAILGAAGAAHSVDQVRVSIQQAVRTYTLERNGPISAAAYREILRDAATVNGVACVGAARTATGEAKLIEVDRAGSVFEPPLVAIGTGASITLGALESIDREQSLASLTVDLEELMAVVAERDPETSDSTSVVTLHDTQIE